MPHANLDERRKYQREYKRRYVLLHPEYTKIIYERHKEKKKIYRQKWMKNHRSYMNIKKKEFVEKTFKSFLAQILNRTKNRRRIKVEIDLEYLLIMLEKQKYRCAISGILMTHEYNNLRSISIDRINSKDNYCIGNIQLVCQFVNWGKNKFSNDDVNKFFTDVINQENQEEQSCLTA